MGQEAELLEDHGGLGAPEVRQLLVAERQDIVIVYKDGAGGWVDEAVDAADHGGLAASGEAHDHEGLPVMHVEADVLQSHDAVVGGLGLPPGHPGHPLHQVRPFALAKDLPKVSDPYANRAR